MLFFFFAQLVFQVLYVKLVTKFKIWAQKSSKSDSVKNKVYCNEIIILYLLFSQKSDVAVVHEYSNRCHLALLGVVNSVKLAQDNLCCFSKIESDTEDPTVKRKTGKYKSSCLSTCNMKNWSLNI